jgi:hypothetical protein
MNKKSDLAPHKPMTLLDAVEESLAAAGRFNRDDAAAPMAILWTDGDGQWRPIVDLLRPRRTELLTYGVFNPEKRTGPAIWLRCAIEKKLKEVEIPEGIIPILYLPNVSRQTLKAAEECPDDLKPFVELQYRGSIWGQSNGRDWTVEAFLVSKDGGLGLDLAKDARTRQALEGALSALAGAPLENFRGKRLESEDFDRLIVEDTPHDILHWLDDPKGIRATWDAAKWKAFRSRCRSEYEFDPETEGELRGAELLGVRQGAWASVWGRYAEAPMNYPNMPALLRRAKPSGLIFDKEPWPDENDNLESALRVALAEAGTKSQTETRQIIADLEAEHRDRRSWIWAKLGRSPLSLVLKPLAVLAKATEIGLGGDSLEGMAEGYASSGYLADDAVVRAWAAVRTPEDQAAVQSAIQALYLPWLDDGARKFQDLLRGEELNRITKIKLKLGVFETKECLIFCDGLRFDLGCRLVASVEDRGMKARVAPKWAAWPTVTATSKPAASPAAALFKGNAASPDFLPVHEKSGQAFTAERLRKILAERGYQILEENEVGNPGRADAKAWTEFGDIDKLGHGLGAGMATQIQDQIEQLADRVQRLLSAGWASVRVITDHGWLFVPGELPKVDLPKYLTETRWRRCAVVQEGAGRDIPRAPWFWNSTVSFAFGRGVYCFTQGSVYAHGGLSLQECLVPEITVRGSEKAAGGVVVISEVHWAGLRCRMRTEPGAEGFSVELRTRLNDPDSRIGEAKTIDSEGRAALLVEDDGLAGSSVLVVVIDSLGQVKARFSTIIGGEE